MANIKPQLRIQYASDLHLEFRENFQFIKSEALEVTGDVLVLAGDTFYLNDTTMPKTKFWKWASKNYRQVLLVPGNHEFYNNGDVTVRGDNWSYMFYENVGYYYNKVVRIDDTDFILTTLWSYIKAEDAFFIQRGMNDFTQIKYDGRRINTDDYNAEHNKCLAFIKKSVSESIADHIVVVTHHLPTFEVVQPIFKTDTLTSAYATELGNYIADSRIDYWIYGHSHKSIEAQIGNTKIISNQMGYIFTGEYQREFDGSKYFEL